jgi:hypothetical protein
MGFILWNVRNSSEPSPVGVDGFLESVDCSYHVILGPSKYPLAIGK